MSYGGGSGTLETFKLKKKMLTEQHNQLTSLPVCTLYYSKGKNQDQYKVTEEVNFRSTKERIF